MVLKYDLTDSVASYCSQAAFDHDMKNDLKMKVTCPYLQKYLEEHALPEYTSQIVEYRYLLTLIVLLVSHLDYYTFNLDYARILCDFREKRKETKNPLLSEAYNIEFRFYEGL
jgi:hypothetical protein